MAALAEALAAVTVQDREVLTDEEFETLRQARDVAANLRRTW
jgi:hypothetical protein